MTGDCRKTREIATAEIERDELTERQGIHCEWHQAIDREVNDLASDQKVSIGSGN